VANRATSPETAHKAAAAAAAATTTVTAAAVVGVHATVAVKRDISPETAPATTTAVATTTVGSSNKITIRGLGQWSMIVEGQWSMYMDV